ncbi:MAG: hypothetical protein VYE22_19625 [Myxococcota bacterium]|nr:hypothetical protein [Myxococcota bacterium]
MENAHTLVYRRFFAITLSVVPGLNLVLGIAALILYILADIVMMEWGWALGVAAIVLCLTFVGWIFVGLGVQKWAEDKSTGLLFGLNAPFMIVDFAFLAWLFWHTVIGFIMGGHEEEARAIVETISRLA